MFLPVALPAQAANEPFGGTGGPLQCCWISRWSARKLISSCPASRRISGFFGFLSLISWTPDRVLVDAHSLSPVLITTPTNLLPSISAARV
jgi:hypothetical protein